MKFIEVNFNKMNFNLNGSRVDVEVAYDILNLKDLDEKVDEKREKVINKQISIKREAGELKIDVNTIKNRLDTHIFTSYNNKTIALENSLDTTKLIEFLENKSNEVFTLKSSDIIYYGSLDKNAINIEFKIEDSEVISQKDIKNSDLKSYETPSNITTLFFDVFQSHYKDRIIKEIVSSLADEIVKQNEMNINNSNDIFNLINSYIKSESLDILIEIDKFKDLIEKLKELHNYNGNFFLKHYNENYLETFKDYTRYKKALSFPILDLQAGSSNDMLKSMDRSGFNENIIIGTELRNIDINDKRVQTRFNTNFMAYANVINSVFEDAQNSKMVNNTFTYLNPPYTNDDLVAKKSIQSLKDGQFFCGLFPTKMKKFIEKYFDGIIANVPRELTGYTEKNTPERFLLVYGFKNSIYEADESKKMKLTSMATPENIYITINESDIFEASKVFQKELKKFELKNSINVSNALSIFHTYHNRDGSKEFLKNKLYRAIDEFEIFLKESENIKKTINNNLDNIFKSFSPMEALKNQKVFHDLREFNKNGKYQKFSFDEIKNNFPFLQAYKQKYPELYNIIEEIAKDKNIALPTSTIEPIKAFSLLKNNVIEKRDKITNSHLGMVKLAYLPQYIDLSTNTAKEKFLEIINLILEDNKIEKFNLNELKNILKNSERLLIKNEKKVIEESEGNKESKLLSPVDVLVFIDKRDRDIAKLNISLTDFYNKLEELKIFDINDYVELPTLSSNKKRVVFDKFTLWVENILRTLTQQDTNEDINQNILYKDLVKKFKEILAKDRELKLKLQKKEITEDEYIKQFNEFKNNKAYDFLNANSLSEIYSEIHLKLKDDKEYRDEFKSIKDFYIDKAIMPNIIDEVENYLKSIFELSEKTKENITSFLENRFINRETTFFEDERSENMNYLFNTLKNDFFNTYKQSSLTLNEIEDKAKSALGEIEKILINAYEIKKSLRNAYVKLTHLLFYTYMPITFYKNNPRTKDITSEELYDKFFKKFALDTLGLKPHQFEWAERCLEITDDVKLFNQIWEMRSGKTLSFAQKVFIEMLYFNQDGSLIVQSANMQDIATQLLRFMPQLYFNLEIIAPKSNQNKILLNDKIKFTMLPQKGFFPNILNNSFKLKFVLRDNAKSIQMLSRTYADEFEDILKSVDEIVKNKFNGSNVEYFKHLKEKHKDNTNLTKILNGKNKNFLNIKIATFIYLFRLKEKGVLLDENFEDISKHFNQKLSKTIEEYLENLDKSKEIKAYKREPLNIRLISKSSLNAINYNDLLEQETQVIDSHFNLTFKNEIDRDIVKVEGKNIDYRGYLEVLKNSFELPSFQEGIYLIGDMDRKSDIKNFIIDEIREIILTQNQGLSDSYSFNSLINSLKEYLNDMQIEQQSINEGIIYFNKNQMSDSIIIYNDTMQNDFSTAIKQIHSTLDNNHILDNLTSIQKEKILSEIENLKLFDLIEKFADDNNSVINSLFKKFGRIDYVNDKIFRNRGYKESIEAIAKNYKMETLKQKEVRSSVEDKISIKLNFIGNGEVLTPILSNKDGQNYFYKINSYLNRANRDDLELITKETTMPTNLKFNFEKDSQLNIEFAFDEENVKPIFNINKRGDISYLYSKDTLKDFKIVAIDEADTGLKGEGSNILREISKNSLVTTVASGTATGGYVQELAYMLGYSANVSRENLEKLALEIEKQCGNYKIDKTSINVLLDLTENEEFANKFKAQANKFYITLYSFEKRDKKNIDLFKISKDGGKLIFNTLSSIDDERLDKLEITHINSLMYRIFNDYSEAIKNNIIDKDSELKDILINIFINKGSKYIKKAVGFNNPITVASMMNGFDKTNVSIQTRETLHKIEENVYYLDENNFNYTKSNLDSISVDDVLEKNNIGIRIFSRYYSDKADKEFIGSLKNFLISNFDFMIKSIFEESRDKIKVDKHNMGYLIKNISIKDDIKVRSLMQKSGISVNDDMVSLYRNYLKNNANIEDMNYFKGDKNIEKKELFKEILKFFNREFLNKITRLQSENYTPAKNSFQFKNLFLQTYYEKHSGKDDIYSLDITDLDFEDAYPIGYKFSKDFEIMKDDWREFLSKPIKYKYTLGNDLEADILDSLGSDGLVKLIEDELNNENGFLLSSSRVLGTEMNLYNLLSLSKNRDSQKKLIILMNTTDSRLKEAINKIDENYLKKNNIELIGVERNELDSTKESLKARANSQMVVISNYESVSRGLDLSNLDTIIATGAMNKGRELIQMLSRIFSVDKHEGNVYMFHGGGDIDFNLKYEDISDIVGDKTLNQLLNISKTEQEDLLTQIGDIEKISKLTRTALLQDISKAKVDTYKLMMSGQKADISKNNFNKIVTLTDSFEEKLNKEIEEVIKEGQGMKV